MPPLSTANQSISEDLLSNLKNIQEQSKYLI